MIEKQEFVSCDEECQRAMSSVMDANLLLFKTVIAGDSWGDLTFQLRCFSFGRLLRFLFSRV